MRKQPIFEKTVSPLYQSNDGRLVAYTAHDVVDEPVTWYVVCEGTEVLRTRDRILVDAYIAGYDLAKS